MKMNRGLLLLALPLLAGAALLIAAVSLRPGSPQDTSPQRKAAPAETAARKSAPPAPSAKPKELPKPAPADALARAADDARIRGSYQNYRTAVATGNTSLQRALEKTLQRDREAALRFAREEVARAQNSRDREIASRTLEALGR